ncbi:anaerobic sulfite reductase subunit AsrA [Parasporobacterium paucivorans]|uniref:Anaerobic sulfite reductase subunit A n=1 Tax=Parasporobacterium paucivorans DSM 15970 TaxID=1122934 RepID=A0A1M6E7K6_9FIRM|nr:anaerobic sulfite reductase subunit AsrA [Parasporobacterium paucivorans]SHI81431.1 anaerobic sulfite reductase subunit A [Parasporobacterium paucivorans DSM 15970]
MDVKSEVLTMMTGRENLYNLLCRIYKKEVDQKLLDNMKDMVFPTDGMNPELTEGYRLLQEYFETTGENAEEDLAVDFAKVFLSAGASQGMAAFPYESVYTSRKRIILQEAWEQVSNIYATKGLALEDVPPDFMEDHIACELEYMAYLCREAKQTRNLLKNLQDQQEFLEQHLLKWGPSFCEDVYNYSDTVFYKAVAKITSGFLKLDQEILDSLRESAENILESRRSCFVSNDRMDAVFEQLKEKYVIYAPKRFKGGGMKHANLIRYAKIESIREIEMDEQSDFSPKEAYYPVSQTMLYFTEEEVLESAVKDERDILVFARPCDINGMNRLDTIFLNNGGKEDLYYKRLRKKVKIAMLECLTGWEDCFCVSMGTNKTNNYSLAVRFEEDGLLVEIKDKDLASYFLEEEDREFTPEFIAENEKKVRIPEITNRETLRKASELKFWEQFDERCIGCGGCNTVCGTCSCFDTVDIIYKEGSQEGERKRVWSSCMLENFTETAGGSRARKTNGANMRFKVLHKFYDYHARFGGEEQMCVGCGRCDMRCPQDISFYDTVNGLCDELDKMKEDTAKEVRE